MDSQAARAAKNEALFRDVNERIVDVATTFEAEGLEVLCECSDTGCTATLEITRTEYAAVRARGDRFAVVAGHDDSVVERVIERNERFFVVEKLGAAGDVAQDVDPRA